MSVLVPLAIWELGCALYEKAERRHLFARAREAARRRGKPMLVVGEPDGEYPCADVLVDLRPTSLCPNHVRTSVESMPMFRDRQFGAVLISHVLEHVENPLAALRELNRVADTVWISYPRPWRLTTYLVPGHTWLMIPNGAGGFRFVRLRATSNIPNRYGLQGVDDWSELVHAASPTLRGTFLRQGPPRTAIVGAAVGIGRTGDPRALRWATTNGAGRFALAVPDAGPWSLRTRVQGQLLSVPVGYVSADRAVDLVVLAGGVAVAYAAGTRRRAYALG